MPVSCPCPVLLLAVKGRCPIHGAKADPQTHTYIPTFIPTSTGAHSSLWTCSHIQPHTTQTLTHRHAHMFTYAQTCLTHTNTFTCTRKHSQTHSHMDMLIYIHTAHTITHRHTRTNTNMHAHTTVNLVWGLIPFSFYQEIFRKRVFHPFISSVLPLPLPFSISWVHLALRA